MNPLPSWQALPTWAKLATIPMIIVGFAIVAEVTLVILFAIVESVDSVTRSIRKFFQRRAGPKVIDGGRATG